MGRRRVNIRRGRWTLGGWTLEVFGMVFDALTN